MRGSTYKRCPCPPEYDKRGRRRACPRRHGSWYFVIDVGKSPTTGRRHQLRRGGFSTQAAAAEALAAALTRFSAGRYRHDNQQTVADFLDRWVEAKASMVRPSTLKEYRRHIRVHLVPTLGRLRLRDLRTGHINEMLRAFSAPDAGDGLGPTTVRRIHATLRSALSDAVRDELIESNPARNATPPRVARPKVRPWEPDELGRFLDFVSGDPMAPLFELMALAGLRRGEALGLRWADVDLDRGFLVVRQQVVQLAGHVLDCPACDGQHRGILLGSPKTASGDSRRVDLGGTAIGMLLEHRLHQDQRRTEWGPLYREHGLVFPADNGDPLQPERVTKTFARFVRASGLPHVRLHDLRHGRASLLLASGADLALVSKMMGHSSVTLTADTYSHMLAGVGQQVADRADALIPRRPRDQSVTMVTITSKKALPAKAVKGR